MLQLVLNDSYINTRIYDLYEIIAKESRDTVSLFFFAANAHAHDEYWTIYYDYEQELMLYGDPEEQLIKMIYTIWYDGRFTFEDEIENEIINKPQKEVW